MLDSGMLCRLFRSPDVYTPSSDDFSKPEDVQKFIDAAVSSPHFYILGRNPKTEAYIFAPNHNFATFQAHIGIRKDHRDGSIPERCAEASKWMFENTTCRTIIGFVREDNTGPLLRAERYAPILIKMVNLLARLGRVRVILERVGLERVVVQQVRLFGQFFDHAGTCCC